MAIRKTIQIGEPVLRETTKSVEKHDDVYVTQVITDLVDTMRAVELVGMAAPQIGESVRIFVIEVRETTYRNNAYAPLKVFINPIITERSTETETGYEGCGSVAAGGLFGEVERAQEVTVAYTNQDGVALTETFTGFSARIIQHEMDHLEGTEFTDISDPHTFMGREYYIEHHRSGK